MLTDKQLKIGALAFIAFLGILIAWHLLENQDDLDYLTSSEETLSNATSLPDLDICKCLTEPQGSEYMTQNGKACDDVISKEIGVPNWRKVNMKWDKVPSKKFDSLVYRCTGEIPEAITINGVYSHTGGNTTIEIVVSDKSWSGKTKMISGFGSIQDDNNAMYDRGTVIGNDLYDASGFSKIGYISDNLLVTTIGGRSVTLHKQ